MTRDSPFFVFSLMLIACLIILLTTKQLGENCMCLCEMLSLTPLAPRIQHQRSPVSIDLDLDLPDLCLRKVRTRQVFLEDVSHSSVREIQDPVTVPSRPYPSQNLPRENIF